MNIATRVKFEHLFYTGYKLLACIPAIWLLLFAGFILHTKLADSALALHGSPKNLAIYLHYHLTFWGLILTLWSLPVTFLLTIALFFQERWLVLSSYVFLFLLGALGYCFLVFADAFGLVSWFID